MSVIDLFVNPIAGQGRGANIAGKIVRRFARAKTTVRIFREDPLAISDAALQGEPARAAIVIGGDETIRATVERLLRPRGASSASFPPILVIPYGTANLMAQNLRLDWDDERIDEQAFEAIEQMKIRQLDAAQANGRPLLLMAGVGLDAAIVHELARLRRGPISRASYALPALNALLKYDFPPLTVEIDGRRVIRNEPAMAFAGCVPEYGTGFPILASAVAGDGHLDLCILPCQSPRQLMQLLLAVAAGTHQQEEGVIYQTGRSVRIDSPAPIPVQIDGEASGFTPLSIDLLPVKVPFIVQ